MQWVRGIGGTRQTHRAQSYLLGWIGVCRSFLFLVHDGGHSELLLGVGVHVLHHMILSDEPLATLLTGIRLGARVQTHVPSQISFVVEHLRALLTFERFVALMLREVLLVRLIAGKSFATSLTLERLVAAVESFVVLCQVARFVKHFVALHTSMLGGANHGWYNRRDYLLSARDARRVGSRWMRCVSHLLVPFVVVALVLLGNVRREWWSQVLNYSTCVARHDLVRGHCLSGNVLVHWGKGLQQIVIWLHRVDLRKKNF